MGAITVDKRMNPYFVMAKMDEGDAPFDRELVERTYPENYELVPGHVWAVLSEQTSSYDVAKTLGLMSGGTEDASGMVVAPRGYWGFAEKKLLRLLQSASENKPSDSKDVTGWWNRLRRTG